MSVTINFERSKMNKDDFKLAADDLFENSSFKLINIQQPDKYFYNFVAADGNTKAVLSLTDPEDHAAITRGNSLTFIDYLNANSILFFEKVKKEQVEQLFSHLNYEYMDKIIAACYAMGNDLGFYENINRNPTFNLADGFNFLKNKTTSKSKAVLTNIGEIHFQPTVVEQNTDNLRWIRKKSICVYVRFKIINNETHPFVLLTIPYAPRKNITLHVDLHPSFAEESKTKFNLIMKEFEDTLSYYLGTLLKRHLKMKQKDLDKLSLEDKKNYLIIAHMNKI